MAYCSELWSTRETLQLVEHRGAAKVDPSDYAADERILIRQIEKPAGFIDGLPRLHGDGRVDARGADERRQVCGQEIPPQRVHFVVDPRVIGRIVFPEVLVGINFHALTGTTADRGLMLVSAAAGQAWRLFGTHKRSVRPAVPALQRSGRLLFATI